MSRRDIRDLELQKFDEEGRVRTNQDPEESTSTCLEDGKGTSNRAKITSRGQLITSPLEFSTMYPCEITSDGGICQVISPISKHDFIITDIIINADKAVPAGGTIVTLYESNTDDQSEDIIIFKQELPKESTIPLSGLNILVPAGVWVNITATESNIFANIGGYFTKQE